MLNINMENNNQPTENTSSQLSLNDIATMKNVINVLSSRGAFKPEEMAVVGQLYIKLTQFIDSVTTTTVAEPTTAIPTEQGD